MYLVLIKKKEKKKTSAEINVTYTMYNGQLNLSTQWATRFLCKLTKE